MSEFFELTFFSEKKQSANETNVDQLLSLLMLRSGKNIIKQHSFSIFENKEIWFNVFEESDFFEYQICISDFAITKTNFDEIVNQLLEIVEVSFERINSISFATGIYELTYYYTENVRRLADFNDDIMKKFPLLFMKNDCRFKTCNSQKYNNIFYVVTTGEGIQNIFSD